MIKNKYADAALGGILKNPVLVMVLGLCPTMAQTTTLFDAFGLGVATTIVLIMSNVMISVLRRVIPEKVRIPCYIIIIATFATLVIMSVKSFMPSLYDNIGASLNLIVVNCIILGRAEAFASKNKVTLSLLDGVSMGLGFTMVVSLIGGIREFLWSVCGIAAFSTIFGGFFVMGVLMGIFNFVMAYVMNKQGAKERRLTQ